MTQTAGAKFRQAIEQEKPLQIVGAINAYCAILAEKSGHKALYLSGAGVANASYGLPDLGMTTLDNVLEDARRIVAASDVPLLVDIDVGWDDVAGTIKAMEMAGVAAVHMEDQVSQKRCGHRPGKTLVSKEEMGERIKEAVLAKTDESFVVMARCDALASEGLDAVIERSAYYAQCGADAIFAEAMTDLSHYRDIKDAIGIPLLANITEFGKTDLYTTDELYGAGVDMALYPLSAFRAMSKVALDVYQTLLSAGSQESVIETMQTREELYDYLDYHTFEKKIDKFLRQEG
ncbi:MAG: methylisocitrate lyase [Zetaproteobacteria bacterium]|nr:MAG: methylisocitrate lyase [Zetaproteobacteria bacterium]